jgi:TatD DNase family protein
MEFFNLHTHKYSSNSLVLELVNQYPWDFDDSIPFYSIGIHPWYIEEKRLNEDFKILEEEIQKMNCLAMGECGLDKRIDIPLDMQLDVFEKQLILAEKYQKPVILHCVAAFQEIIALKKKFNITVPMIIHGFSKNEQTSKQLLENGFYLSFGKYLLKNPELEKVFKNVPDDKFFLETDTIEETIEEVYAKAAKSKKTTILQVQELVNNNFKSVFTIN